jgi:phosphoheptose isomerase
MEVGFAAYPATPARLPRHGHSPAIDGTGHPLGTRISAVSVFGRRFTLYGRKANGDDNSGDVRVGISGSGNQPQIVPTGQEVPLECADTSQIDLADYYVTGTDGDGIEWFLVP